MGSGEAGGGRGDISLGSEGKIAMQKSPGCLGIWNMRIEHEKTVQGKYSFGGAPENSKY